MSGPVPIEAQRALARELLRALAKYQRFLLQLEQHGMRFDEMVDEMRCVADLARHGRITPALSVTWVHFYIGHITVLQAWARNEQRGTPPDAPLQQACMEQYVLLRTLRKQAMALASA